MCSNMFPVLPSNRVEYIKKLRQIIKIVNKTPVWKMKRRGSSLLLNLFLALSGVFLCVAFGSGHHREKESLERWRFG